VRVFWGRDAIPDVVPAPHPSRTSHPATPERNVSQLCANGGACGALSASVSLALVTDVTE